MDGLVRRVLSTIREHALVGADDRVAVALSGGFDSVALLLILRELAEAGRPAGRLAGVIHVNHGLRGAESDRDERFCRALAERLGLPIAVGRFDVAAVAHGTRRSLEAAARDVRYQFFEEAAATLDATSVATAHTLDDQAETVLLRLLRGAGSRGLGGIRVRRGLYIRPLLGCRRGEIREYLADRGETACEDSSNASLAIPRNRVRHQLLPVIEAIAPGSVEALARFAATAADDESYLEEVAATLALDGNVGRLPPALARRVVRRALEAAAPGRAFSAGHLDETVDMAGRAGTGARDLPGVTVRSRDGALSIQARDKDVGESAGWAPFEVALPIPGRASLPGGRVSVSAAIQPGVVSEEMRAGGDTAVVQANVLAAPLVVRNRRPGDRLRPLGAPGHRKLQDLLVDRKVPRDERDRVPLVVDATGRIVWVAGIAIADECRVTAPAAGVVVLKVLREGIS